MNNRQKKGPTGKPKWNHNQLKYIQMKKKEEFNKVLSPLRVLMNVNPLKGHGNESK